MRRTIIGFALILSSCGTISTPDTPAAPPSPSGIVQREQLTASSPSTMATVIPTPPPASLLAARAPRVAPNWFTQAQRGIDRADPLVNLYCVTAEDAAELVASVKDATARNAVERSVPKGEVLVELCTSGDRFVSLQTARHTRDLLDETASSEHLLVLRRAERVWDVQEQTDLPIGNSCRMAVVTDADVQYVCSPTRESQENRRSHQTYRLSGNLQPELIGETISDWSGNAPVIPVSTGGTTCMSRTVDELVARPEFEALTKLGLSADALDIPLPGASWSITQICTFQYGVVFTLVNQNDQVHMFLEESASRVPNGYVLVRSLGNDGWHDGAAAGYCPPSGDIGMYTISYATTEGIGYRCGGGDGPGGFSREEFLPFRDAPARIQSLATYFYLSFGGTPSNE